MKVPAARAIVILLLVFAVRADAQQPDPRGQALTNLRADLIALETQLRHVEDAFGALDGQSQKDISFLADKTAWWEGCAKDKACWEWLRPPDKVGER